MILAQISRLVDRFAELCRTFGVGNRQGVSAKRPKTCPRTIEPRKAKVDFAGDVIFDTDS